jgi:hypothetical protein
VSRQDPPVHGLARRWSSGCERLARRDAPVLRRPALLGPHPNVLPLSWAVGRMTPQRIQRQRTKGWRMPEGAVYVGRPTRWGNAWQFNAASDTSRRVAIGHFRRYAETMIAADTDYVREQWIGRLRGRDLACWCPLDKPCHADVLLELANR